MWHETQKEMATLIDSVFNLFKYQSAIELDSKNFFELEGNFFIHVLITCIKKINFKINTNSTYNIR